ncbi:MAG: YkgJ family cysteine cluster protein [Desulfuromonadales bacterium]|nr:YkgJ family cysteine cluster protein [Desulfuromonadales bacterium]
MKIAHVQRALHRQNRFESRWRRRCADLTLHCRPGCAACCRLAVHCSLAEAVAVAAGLDAARERILSAYVDRLLAAAPGLADLASYLRAHCRGLGPCPFLASDGRCDIYAVRPLSCRALLSTRPAAWCAIEPADLDDFDKQLLQQSLDPQLVAWPTHYLAATQNFARRQEERLTAAMLSESGWALSGNFPLQVWLERRHRLSERGGAEVAALLAGLGLLTTPLLDLQR